MFLQRMSTCLELGREVHKAKVEILLGNRIMPLSSIKRKILWRQVFGHDDCIADIHFLDGTILLDVTDEDWKKKMFGMTYYYKEVEDIRPLTKKRKYSLSHIIDRVVFQCSSCTKERKCRKLFKDSNRREEA